MDGTTTGGVLLRNSAAERWLFAAMVLAGVVLFGYATGVLMAPFAPALGDRLAELTCLQLAFTPERAAAVLGGFSAAQREAIARLLVPGDLVFAFGYGLLLAGLLGLLARRLDGGWRRAGRIVMWAPLAASVLDCIEDAFLYQVNAAAVVDDTGLLPLLAGLAATLKYLMLSVVTPAFAVAGSARGLVVDRRPGALLLYALVVLMGLSMLARPLQQVPACF